MEEEEQEKKTADHALKKDDERDWTSSKALLLGVVAGIAVTSLAALLAVVVFKRRATSKSLPSRRLLSVGAPSPPMTARKPPYLFGTASTALAAVAEPYRGLEAMLEPIYSEPKNGE